VAVAIWSSPFIHIARVDRQLTPNTLLALVKPGKSRQIVANETAILALFETGEINGGDAIRFLKGGESAADGKASTV
jgi:hypothetical protein